jgi:hypothetical protein
VVPAPSRQVKQEAADWCRAQMSIGRFYNHYTNTRWWFECERDAILFALRWQAAPQNTTRLATWHSGVTCSTGPR